MHVLVINRYFHPDHAPTSVLLSELAFALKRQGIEVTAVTSRLHYDENSALALPREVVGGVEVYRLWSSSWGRSHLLGRSIDYLSFYMSCTWRLWRLAPKADVILTKTDPPLLSVVAAVIARLRGSKNVNWLQDVFPEVAEALGVGGRPGKAALGLSRPLRNWSLKTACMNVAVGETMAQHLETLGVSRERICVISNWADGDLIRPTPPSRNKLRKMWGLNDRIVVGYAGNLGRAHDVETHIETISLLQEHVTGAAEDDIARRIKFVFVGGGAQHEKLKAAVSRKHLNNVQIHPYQPESRLSETLGLADIHIVSLNPKLEGLIVPSKFYGIAAAGRPMIFIGAADGEIARLVEQAGCGFSVSSGDAMGLKSRILELTHDPELRGRMGKNARAAFEGLWDKSQALHKWVELLKHVTRES